MLETGLELVCAQVADPHAADSSLHVRARAAPDGAALFPGAVVAWAENLLDRPRYSITVFLSV